MRALVITGPGRAEVQEVDPPTAAPGEVVVEVERAGICGTDAEIFSGHMSYLEQGVSRFPMRIGHEWCGRVSAVGAGVDPGWLDRRVMGDTMLGCGSCRRCRRGHQHVCAAREEVGIRGARAGALAEQLAVPANSLHALPDAVGPTSGALVEPGGNALRAVQGAQLSDGDRVLIMGPGTIGLLSTLFARATGAEVHVLGLPGPHLELARTLGLDGVWDDATLPDLPWDAVIDAGGAPLLPARAVELVEPGGRAVFIGLAGTPTPVDSRELVLADVTAVGVLSASPALEETIAAYASGAVDPCPIVGSTIALEEVPDVLAATPGRGREGAEPRRGPTTAPARPRGPKVHIDPHL